MASGDVQSLSPRIPRGWGTGGEWWGGQRLRWESAIAAVPPVLLQWSAVKHQRWPLASGPGRKTWLHCCWKCALSTLAIYIYIYDTKGIRHTVWESRNVQEVLASAEGSKTKGKVKMWGGKQGNRQARGSAITLTVHHVGKKESSGTKKKKRKEKRRRKRNEEKQREQQKPNYSKLFISTVNANQNFTDNISWL